MQPYVIRQGDFLLALAHQFGFDADTVWNDPKNAQLRQLRPNPNILYPTDVLYIPDQNASPVMQSLATGTTNNFVSSAPTTTLSVTFVGNDPTAYASKAYTIQELDQLTGVVTDGNGVAKFDAPVTLQNATLVFTETGASYALSIGGMDPIDTLSGIFLRLQNLGYIGGAVPFDASNLDLLRTALRALKASQASSSDDSAPASSPAPNSGPGSSPAPNSAPGSGPSLDSAPGSSPAPNSAPASSPAPNSVPGSSPAPNSAPGSSPSSDSSPGSSANGASDNAGLADDGTLDAPTTALLLKVHGS